MPRGLLILLSLLSFPRRSLCSSATKAAAERVDTSGEITMGIDTEADAAVDVLVLRNSGALATVAGGAVTRSV